LTSLPTDPVARGRLKAILEARAAATSWRCELAECDGRPHQGKPEPHARSAQLPPWDFRKQDGIPVKRWYLRGGRGSGKTWAGARALAEIILWHGGADESGNHRSYGIVGPNFGYTQDTLVEGDSGLLIALGGEGGPHIEFYNRSKGIIYLKSGARVYTAGADNFGKGIEGKNMSAIWCDEVGLWSLRRWKYVWENAIRFAVRKNPALYILTGTPKEGHPFVVELVNDSRTLKVVMATKDNPALPPEQLAEWEELYAGTRLGRQELDGEVLVDTPGALWSSALIENSRIHEGLAPEELVRIFVGWDPAVTSNSDSDEHGIVVVGQLPGDPSHYAVLEDASGRFSPMEAVRRVSGVFEKWGANAVVAETNNGGDMIGALLRTHTTTIPLTTVTATRGKRLRAEPVASLSEQGRLHMVGTHPKLEDQMTKWSPESPGSPDRLDAMVWAVTALQEKGATSRAFVGKHRISIRSN
jgi:phage terminase large subunit-like protein